MYKIGQKVQLVDTGSPITGYIVKMEIDPIEEVDIASEVEDWIIYTIRVYGCFYRDGYTDYYSTESGIKDADD